MNKIAFYDDEIKTLYCSEGMTMRQISEILNISVGKVYNRLKYMEIPSRSQGDYEPTAKVLESARRQGLKHKGKRLSEETKEKISKSHFKGGSRSKETKG